METRSGDPRDPRSLLDRLHQTYDTLHTANANPIKRVEEVGFLPRNPMRTASLPFDEVFKRLAIEVVAFQIGDGTPMRGKNRLSYAYSLAKQLQSDFDKNPQDREVYDEKIKSLKEKFPELVEDITLIMQRVSDKKRFKARR